MKLPKQLSLRHFYV